MVTVPSRLAQEGNSNHLLRALGRWRFHDIEVVAALFGPRRYSWTYPTASKVCSEFSFQTEEEHGTSIYYSAMAATYK
jgi:phenolic acid decarboxylase